MKLMKYVGDSDETEETTKLFMDGYFFGDRLLEGVPFKITIVNEELKAECLDKYQKGIDWDYWEKVCVERALQEDVFSTSSDLDDDAGFIEI